MTVPVALPSAVTRLPALGMSMSRQGMPVLIITPDNAPPALTASAGSDGPTARARAEGKRGPRTPYAATALCGGETAGHR
jgi:hypothetical protein